MINSLRQYAARQMFHPSLLGLLINPYYHARRGLRKHIRQMAPSLKGNVLDVGCGQKPYRELFDVSSYLGMELDTPDNRQDKRADVYYDGQAFPFPDGAFDGVLLFQVLEHVFNPEVFLGQVARVLRDNGHLLLSVPFVWDEHEQPYDYARYSSFGLTHLLRAHRLEVVELRRNLPDLRVIAQLINAYLYKKTVTGNAYTNALVTLALMSPINALGVLAGLLPGNKDLYLDNIVLARRVPRE
jgi:SAM-dependent methyltransferase